MHPLSLFGPPPGSGCGQDSASTRIWPERLPPNACKPERFIAMFHGSIPALVTPFDAGGAFVEGAYRDLVEKTRARDT